ncbi:MAG: DUF3106 domain-containing protein, partial [candidate division NC10 bacterium]|nr:DUF3106 domain-containing protein [candidate division NC10 bacterium]
MGRVFRGAIGYAGVLLLAWGACGPLLLPHAAGEAPPATARPGPEERARLEEAWQRWRSLPPEERARIRRNFERWQRLSPEEREAFQERQEALRRLSPAERERLRENLQ